MDTDLLMRSAPPQVSNPVLLPFFTGRLHLTESRLTERRFFLHVAFFSPLALVGCGNTQDDTHVPIGEKTKEEAKARAEVYKQRALAKQRAAPKR